MLASERFCPTVIVWTSPSRWRSSGTSTRPGGDALGDAEAATTSLPCSSTRPPERRQPAGDAFHHFGAAGAHQAVDADDLAGPDVEREAVDRPSSPAPPARHAEVLDRAARPRPSRSRSAASRDRSSRRPCCARSTRDRSRCAAAAGGHGAVAQDHGVVGDLQRLLEVVRDVDDRDAAARQVADHLEQHLDLGGASAEVGSSMIRMRELTDRARAISTICCWPRRRSSTRVSGSMSSSSSSISARVWRSSSAKSTPVGAGDLAAHEDVVADAQVRREAEFLVDDRDAAVARLGGRGEARPARRRGRSRRRWGGPRRRASSSASTCRRRSRRTSVVTWPRWMSKLTPLSAWMRAVGSWRRCGRRARPRSRRGWRSACRSLDASAPPA